MVSTKRLLAVLILASTAAAHAAGPPEAGEPVVVRLPDFGAELRAFDDPETRPVAWWPHVVNAAWGEGRGGPERNGGWLDRNWELVDYIDRSADYTTHEYLTHRGIWYEVYGSNEYQETIHFHEAGAKKLFWDNGIARDMHGERVLSEHYNTGVPWWKEKIGWDAYIVCNNAPRWSAVIDYDWLTSPLLGFAVSQDNIGGPTSRIGAGSHGRYCDFCNAKFFHYLETTGRLPEFRARYRHIRDYVQENLADVVRQTPPYVKPRWDLARAEVLAKLAEPPVMSEYQKFLYLSHLYNFVRYYRDAKLVAARTGRDYDVHGNQGGSAIGPCPYQVALSDFVDTVWFESSGITAYDQFKYGWNNANGAFRYAIGRAMTRGKKPFMSMTGFPKPTPDLVEHEMAEACAGGGVLFVNQLHFEKEPDLQQKLTDYFRFRHDHRALFADQGKTPYVQIAVAYSVPSMMYYNYAYANAPPVTALSGIARALEEGHLPYDVVIFNHPEIHADHATLEDLKAYRLMILPSLECLSDAQVDLLTRYVRGGGTIGLIGQCAARNEDNLPRRESAVAEWRKAGRVVDVLPPGRGFLEVRAKESDATRALTRTAIESVRNALDGKMVLSGDLPRLLWVKTWRHADDFVSLHFVNYDVDFESGNAAPTRPVELAVTLPPGVPGEEAVWLTPDGKAQAVDLRADGPRIAFTVPSVRVYGVLVVGRRGLDAARSGLLEANALWARASMAGGGSWRGLADQADGVGRMAEKAADGLSSPEETADYLNAAGKLFHSVREQGDADYVARLRDAVVADDALAAFDFGASDAKPPWKSVGGDSVYSPDAGFGWLPADDATDPTPEETDYAMAQRHGAKFRGEEPAVGSLLFWPYKQPIPGPLRTNLVSGASRAFRVSVPAGSYTVRVITTNPAWTNRNFLVSGMVSAGGAVRLLDAAHDRGAVVAREFVAIAPQGTLDFTFGGPTGWAVAALVIRSGGTEQADPQIAGGLRRWHVSPRYANPDWYPITQVSGPPEQRLDQIPEEGWTRLQAPGEGLPVIDLGTNREAAVGDVVYAATTIPSIGARAARLHLGASSQAQIWLNGEPLGYIPNEKGVRRDEFVLAVNLRPGRNVLVVKLQRFWERRWLFYAALSDPM
ncbi:MAG TPA: hypothetical protein VMY37_21415 [Thermoguttaceae bacterium]|nr:hypothetical protein [Thermoguttaceae bacterium]